jgi:SAM-dependent methyltransferase
MLGRTWRMAVLAELTHSVRTGQSGFAKLYGKGPFQWFAEHPEEGAIFDDAMTSGSAPTADGVAKSYDFSSFERLAEIGGGHGALLAAILRAHPRVNGVLFDLPHVAAGAKQRLEAAGLAARAEVVGGDFFESVPAGCDAYVMKHILHDWSDEKSVAILRRCREAMRPGGKVLVVDAVVPGRGVPSFAKLLDLQMLISNEGGKERTEAEFADLFAKAGLRLSRVVPTPYRVCIVEGESA